MKKSAFLLLAAPLALAACGSSSSSVALDPVAYVKHAASKTAASPSEHMTMTGKVSFGPVRLTLTGTGDFSNSDHRGSFVGTESVAPGQNQEFDEVLDGGSVYVSSPGVPGLPKGKRWIKLDLLDVEKYGNKHGIDYTSLMSENPTQQMQRLGAAGAVKSLGTETIDGVETTHYQVTNLDISKLPQGAKIEYAPIDVWIGNSDGYVYRYSMSFTYSMSGDSASMTMTVNLSKFGEAVHVTVPPASETVDATKWAGLRAGG